MAIHGRTALIGLLTCLAAASGARAESVLLPIVDGSFVYRPGEYYNDLAGWTDCPPGFAVSGLRVTRYGTLNKNAHHVRCTRVGNLTGFVVTKELNHHYYADAKSGSGYNECPAGHFVVGVFLRRYGTTDKNVTIIKCQRMANAPADALPTLVSLPDGCRLGTAGCASALTESEPSWGFCPAGHAAIGIATEDYAGGGGGGHVTQEIMKRLVARKYAIRFKCQFTPESLCVFDERELSNGAIRFLSKSEAGQWVLQYLTYAWPYLAEAVEVLRFVLGLILGDWDTDEFNRTERGLACVRVPSGC